MYPQGKEKAHACIINSKKSILSLLRMEYRRNTTTMRKSKRIKMIKQECTLPRPTNLTT